MGLIMNLEQIEKHVEKNFPLYKDEVKKQLIETVRWLNVETTEDKVTIDLKCKACREIIKSSRDYPKPEIKIALLSLIVGDFLKNPLSIDIPDVESALWLVRDLEYGFPQTPPTLPVEPVDPISLREACSRVKFIDNLSED